MKFKIKVIDKTVNPPKERYLQYNMTAQLFTEAEARKQVAMWRLLGDKRISYEIEPA